MNIYRQQEEYLRRTLDYSEDSTQPASANSSVCEGPTSPLIVENSLNPMEIDAKHSQEVESLKRLLQEVIVAYCIFFVVLHTIRPLFDGRSFVEFILCSFLTPYLTQAPITPNKLFMTFKWNEPYYS